MSTVDWDQLLNDLSETLSSQKKTVEDEKTRLEIFTDRVENLSLTLEQRKKWSNPSTSLSDLLDQFGDVSAEVRDLSYQISDYLSGDDSIKAEQRLKVAKAEVVAIRDIILMRFS